MLRQSLYPAFRWATTRIGHGRVYTIQRGPLRGLQWQRDHRTNYWYHRGQYEPAFAEHFASVLRPGDRVWDIGANAGYYTLLAASRIRPTGSVVAVEADPEMCALIARQLALNHVSGQIVSAAVTGACEPVRLSCVDNRLMNRLSGDGTLVVDGLTLDALLDRLGHAPTVIKMDIEGAEADALAGCTRIYDYVRTWLVTAHSPELDRACVEHLTAMGVAVNRLPGFPQLVIGHN